MKKAFLLLLFAATAHGQMVVGTLTGTKCVSVDASTTGTAGISVQGSWSGTIQAQTVIGGDPAQNVSVYLDGTKQSTITASGTYTAPTSGATQFQVCGATVTGTANIKLYPAQQSMNLNGGGGGGGGGVTSVAQTVPSWMSVSGSPITTAGTLALTGATGQTSHQVVGTCGSSTTVGQCSLVAGDLPIIPITQVGSAGLSGSGGVSIASTGAISLSAIPIASVGSAGLSGSGGISVASTGVISLSGNLNVGAGTGTSLIVTGILDGTVPVTITTGTSATLGAGTYSSGYTLNQEATAGTGVTYTLPATAAGLQYCVSNSGTTGVVNTGVLTVYPPSSSYVILNGTVNTVGGGGTHGVASGGAAADAACFIAIDSTHWQVFPVKGTWTAN